VLLTAGCGPVPGFPGVYGYAGCTVAGVTVSRLARRRLGRRWGPSRRRNFCCPETALDRDPARSSPNLVRALTGVSPHVRRLLRALMTAVNRYLAARGGCRKISLFGHLASSALLPPPPTWPASGNSKMAASIQLVMTQSTSRQFPYSASFVDIFYQFGTPFAYLRPLMALSTCLQTYYPRVELIPMIKYAKQSYIP
jgi:hypothetical protein